MALMDFLRGRQPQTASVAKDRLQIIVAHQRQTRDAPDWLPALQADVLAALRKYVTVSDDALECNVERASDGEVLELNINLPG